MSTGGADEEPPQIYPISQLKDSQIIKQYLQLKPRFRIAFEKFDTDKTGFLSGAKFNELLNLLNSGAHGKWIVRYEEIRQHTKDIFHREMLRTRINLENMDGDFDGNISFDDFWTHLVSPAVLRRVEQYGLGPIYFFFQAVKIPSFQEEYLSLKPRIIQVFKLFDSGTGFIDKNRFSDFAAVICAEGGKTENELLLEFDQNEDARVSWGEFWKWFEEKTATTQSEMDSMYQRIHSWLGYNRHLSQDFYSATSRARHGEDDRLLTPGSVGSEYLHVE